MNEKTPPPSRSADQFVVRLPEGMREQIAFAAKENNRSMNAEIVSRLQGDAGSSSNQSALIEVIARLNLELARAEASTQNARRERGLLEDKLRAAIYLLGQTQFRHDPEYEILVAQAHDSMPERQAHDDWSGDFAKANEKLKSAEQEWERIARARAPDSL